VIIAHRISTVERCDRVIKLLHGAIECQGSPHEVLSTPRINT